MFINMDPIAGCSAGISGKIRIIDGRRIRARSATRPARSASRITPSHNAMTPISAKAMPITAVLAISRHLSVTSLS